MVSSVHVANWRTALLTESGFVQVMENLESHGILVKVVESHGKAIIMLSEYKKMQKEKKFEKHNR